MKSGEFPTEQAIPVCSTPASINAGFELLVALAVGCVRNLKQIVDTLTDMYYLGKLCLNLTHFPKQSNLTLVFFFVLGGDTLTEWEYLPPVGPRPNKGFVGLKNAGATCYMNSVIQQLYMIPPIRNGILAIEGTARSWVVPLLIRRSAKAAHTGESFLMIYSFTVMFKLIFTCFTRYECEESFTTLNVDIRNHQNLLDSMEQYVKGDLLEGANAYHCEKCNKKVRTQCRWTATLVNAKLPPVLAIQLKRFDYDWERECAIKFNDYFEFPRELDMEPYTVAGVYRLVGVLVHSGQASGGHYYSYIIQRNGGDGEKNRWYKFDDGDVTECKMDDEEEMKNQCFGGEYMGEVFDHMMKRMSYRSSSVHREAQGRSVFQAPLHKGRK
uniref:Ubiquitin carboxyl-terminal hydrolase n=1 Tax=Periophthalmus magnuspinnatus TaxID=409849 RepID=A0A3B4AEH6_9GOBI